MTRPEVKAEFCASVKLARTLNHSAVQYAKFAREFTGQRLCWQAKADAAFAHAAWWLRHSRDLKERWS